MRMTMNEREAKGRHVINERRRMMIHMASWMKRNIGLGLLIVTFSILGVGCSSPISASPPIYMTPLSLELISPEEGALMDNGRTDGRDKIVWDFNWKVEGERSFYRIMVWGPNSTSYLINLTVPINTRSYHYENGGYIIDNNRHGWKWKIQAETVGFWTDTIAVIASSEERSFDVEPVNTDPPQNSSSLQNIRRESK
jgi:hypothetical protein